MTLGLHNYVMPYSLFTYGSLTIYKNNVSKN